MKLSELLRTPSTILWSAVLIVLKRFIRTWVKTSPAHCFGSGSPRADRRLVNRQIWNCLIDHRARFGWWLLRARERWRGELEQNEQEEAQ